MTVPSMTESIAEQIAQLLNAQNELTRRYTAGKVREHPDRYLFLLGDDSRVRGVVELKDVQWYQCEVRHLSVHPDAQRQGLASKLLQNAEARALQLGARIAQCTIRDGNAASEGLFKKTGYVATVTFLNRRSGNRVTVYQKALVSGPEHDAQDIGGVVNG
jgi:N-acetylglutamate synthase-like GNAT family acetyltransferase